MQIPSLPPGAGIAGSAYAAAKGGESEKQAGHAAAQQSAAQTGGGRSEAGSVEAGSETDDRGGNGQEFYDQFESSLDNDSDQPESQSDPLPSSHHDGRRDPPHVDFTA